VVTQVGSFPAKCSTCEMLAQTPLACSDCHTLLEHVAGADYFELFGLKRLYDIDVTVLQKTYLAITRNIHPDAFATADATTQSIMLRMAATINRAYETLQDPVLRAEYLLESSGGKSAADDKRVPPELLGQVMMMREEIEDAKAGGNADTLTRFREQVSQQKTSALQQLADLSRRLDDGGDTVRDDLRLQLNSMKYFNNLLAQL